MTAVVRIDILGDNKSAVRAATGTAGAYDKLGRGADRNKGKVGRFGLAIGGVVRAAGPLGAALSVAGIVKFGFSTIGAASRVEQSFGAIEAVFGKNAATVKAWAKSAADDVGLAKSEYADLAVVTGSMLKNTGIENFSVETKKLITLGADLAAQYGGSTKTAVEAIGSLLRGELDPIEKYGVSIKQSAINAVLAKEGLDGLTGSARTQAEQQARLKILFDQTSTAQGAFRRESDTLQTSQQKLGARFENLKATLGEKLLPVATRFVKWLDATIQGTNDTGKGARRLGDILGKTLSPIVDGAREGWRRFNKGLNDATGSSDGLRKILQKVADWLEKNGPKFGRFIEKYLVVMGDQAGDAAKAIAEISGAIRGLLRWIDKALGPLDELASKLRGVDGVLGGVLSSLPGTSSLGFLLRSADQLPGGLGRMAGLGGLGFSGGTIRVNAPPVSVVVLLDGREIRNTARVEARDEISTQVLAARRQR